MKPECQQALQDIERFLDGEMGEPERGLIDEHLRGCTPCMERADFKRSVKELIASRCGCDDLPPELRERISGVLQTSPRTAPHDA